MRVGGSLEPRQRKSLRRACLPAEANALDASSLSRVRAAVFINGTLTLFNARCVSDCSKLFALPSCCRPIRCSVDLYQHEEASLHCIACLSYVFNHHERDLITMQQHQTHRHGDGRKHAPHVHLKPAT
jgi:hypothetical protein